MKGFSALVTALKNFIEGNPDVLSNLEELTSKELVKLVDESYAKDAAATTEALKAVQSVETFVETARPTSEVGKRLFNQLLPTYIIVVPQMIERRRKIKELTRHDKA